MHTDKIREAIATGNQSKIWTAYKAAWEASDGPDMDGRTFVALLRDNARSEEARKLIDDSDSTKATLEAAGSDPDAIATIVGDANWEDQYVWRVLFELRGVDAVVELWLKERFRASPSDRGDLASTMSAALCAHLAPWDWRGRITDIWRRQVLSQPEQAGILRSLANHDALTPDTFKEFLCRTPFQVGSPDSPERVRERFDALFRLVALKMDLRDAGFSAEEFSQLGHAWSPYLTSAVLSLRRGHPIFYELFEEFLAVPSLSWPSGTRRFDQDQTITFPLIRLLHLRLILESSSLASEISRPEDSLVPEVMLWSLGRDGATYSPELRVHRGVERRWRAWWAERSGEAISVMLLEDALQLDLTTLRRIPETAEETPDFQAQTMTGGAVVFESKGATAWSTHLEQRKKALSQIGKLGRNGRRKRGSVWASAGRSFASCFFAASQGDERSSLLHVDDPPFGFDHLFPQGWETDARTHHYAAVAEAARMYRFADSILQRRREPIFEEEETTLFTLGDEEGPDRLRRFRGTKILLGPQARAMRHPRAVDYERASLFLGMDDQLFTLLAHGRLPSAAELKERRSAPMSHVGLVPATQGGGPPRGVYSYLADGAFLAVLLE